jgi:plasmid stabilization system protein ParE
MTKDEIIEMAEKAGWNKANASDDCFACGIFNLEAFANLVAEAERKKLQGQIETLGAMYELATKQRDVLMDEQRAQVAAWRAEHAITKAKNT